MKFHKSLAEFVELLEVVVPLWLGSLRNIVQLSILELTLVHEATDMQYDEIRIREIRMISIDSCFLIAHSYKKLLARVELIKLIELQDSTSVSLVETKVG